MSCYSVTKEDNNFRSNVIILEVCNESMANSNVLFIMIGISLLIAIVYFIVGRCGREGFESCAEQGNRALKQCLDDADTNFQRCQKLKIQNCQDLYNQNQQSCQFQASLPSGCIDFNH